MKWEDPGLIPLDSSGRPLRRPTRGPYIVYCQAGATGKMRWEDPRLIALDGSGRPLRRVVVPLQASSIDEDRVREIIGRVRSR